MAYIRDPSPSEAAKADVVTYGDAFLRSLFLQNYIKMS